MSEQNLNQPASSRLENFAGPFVRMQLTVDEERDDGD
jgi:hypothetical protein